MCVAVLVAAVDVVAGMAGAAQVAGKASDAIVYLCRSDWCDHSNHNAACLAAADAPKGTFPSCCSFSLAPFLPVCLSLPVRLSLAVCVSLGWLELLGRAGDQSSKNRLFPWVELG